MVKNIITLILNIFLIIFFTPSYSMVPKLIRLPSTKAPKPSLSQQRPTRAIQVEYLPQRPISVPIGEKVDIQPLNPIGKPQVVDLPEMIGQRVPSGNKPSRSRLETIKNIQPQGQSQQIIDLATLDKLENLKKNQKPGSRIAAALTEKKPIEEVQKIFNQEVHAAQKDGYNIILISSKAPKTRLLLSRFFTKTLNSAPTLTTKSIKLDNKPFLSFIKLLDQSIILIERAFTHTFVPLSIGESSPESLFGKLGNTIKQVDDTHGAKMLAETKKLAEEKIAADKLAQAEAEAQAKAAAELQEKTNKETEENAEKKRLAEENAEKLRAKALEDAEKASKAKQDAEEAAIAGEIETAQKTEQALRDQALEAAEKFSEQKDLAQEQALREKEKAIEALKEQALKEAEAASKAKEAAEEALTLNDLKIAEQRAAEKTELLTQAQQEAQQLADKKPAQDIQPEPKKPIVEQKSPQKMPQEDTEITTEQEKTLQDKFTREQAVREQEKIAAEKATEQKNLAQEQTAIEKEKAIESLKEQALKEAEAASKAKEAAEEAATLRDLEIAAQKAAEKAELLTQAQQETQQSAGKKPAQDIQPEPKKPIAQEEPQKMPQEDIESTTKEEQALQEKLTMERALREQENIAAEKSLREQEQQKALQNLTQAQQDAQKLADKNLAQDIQPEPKKPLTEKEEPQRSSQAEEPELPLALEPAKEAQKEEGKIKRIIPIPITTSTDLPEEQEPKPEIPKNNVEILPPELSTEIEEPIAEPAEETPLTPSNKAEKEIPSQSTAYRRKRPQTAPATEPKKAASAAQETPAQTGTYSGSQITLFGYPKSEPYRPFIPNLPRATQQPTSTTKAPTDRSSSSRRSTPKTYTQKPSPEPVEKKPQPIEVTKNRRSKKQMADIAILEAQIKKSQNKIASRETVRPSFKNYLRGLQHLKKAHETKKTTTIAAQSKTKTTKEASSSTWSFIQKTATKITTIITDLGKAIGNYFKHFFGS